MNTSGTRVFEILKSCKAMLEGHFRYTSGRHGRMYFEKIKIIQHPDLVMELGAMMAESMSDIAGEIDAVCAPAYGAITFGYATALKLGRPFAFLQRNSRSAMTIRSGFSEMITGARVLLVEDVVTTGGSIRESIDTLREHGSTVGMVGLLVDRTGGTLELDVPYRALLTVNAESWSTDECPLCKDGLQLTIPGSSGKK